MTIASPCVRKCTLDAPRICQGCHRTLDEIAAWPNADDREKLAILAAVRRRADAIDQRRGGELRESGAAARGA